MMFVILFWNFECLDDVALLMFDVLYFIIFYH